MLAVVAEVLSDGGAGVGRKELGKWDTIGASGIGQSIFKRKKKLKSRKRRRNVSIKTRTCILEGLMVSFRFRLSRIEISRPDDETHTSTQGPETPNTSET